MPDIADIIPSTGEESDRFLVRRDEASPFELALLSNLTPSQLIALVSETIAARGDRDNLNDRISTISNFSSPTGGGLVAGEYYDNSFSTSTSGTLGVAANRVYMSPFFTTQPLTIDEIGVSVSIASAGAMGRCFIYSSDENSWPNELLYEAETDLDFSATGYKNHTLNFTFDRGRQYWLGLRSSAGGTVRGLNDASALNLGLSTNEGGVYLKSVLRVIPFGTPLPSTWDFVAGDRNTLRAPSIRMRAA